MKNRTNMKKQYIAIVALWFIVGVVAAQNERDAFRYAQYSPTGTARYTSLSGSIGAFGADFTALSANNPAGLGLFKRSEIALTLAVPYTYITSNYNGTAYTDLKNDLLKCNNFGLVFASNKSFGNWQKIQFATGYNNLARYGGKSIAMGFNENEMGVRTSFFDYVAESSYGTRSSSLQGIANMAFNYYLIDPVSGKDDQYVSAVNDYFEQQQIKTSSGYLNEWVFSFGGNYDDKLFLGATLGIPFFHYNEKTTYTEYTESYDARYEYLSIYDEFKSEATGINLKLGFIYQPVKFVRLGLAFHTPTTYLNVKERRGENGYEIYGVYQPSDSLYYDVWERNPSGKYDDYQLTTPYRAIANAAFIINKYGFVNIDYEFTDYSTSNLQSNRYSFIEERRNIKLYYRETHTVRVGGEVNLSPLALRLGGTYTTNPYKNLVAKDGSKKDGSSFAICGGIGLKGKSFFVDFAYMYRFTQDKDVFYDAASLSPYSSKIVNQVFALTLGFKMGK